MSKSPDSQPEHSKDLTNQSSTTAEEVSYHAMLGEVVSLLSSARGEVVRSVNSIMTATYWIIGRRIVEFEQKGRERAEYGTAIVERLAKDLTAQLGRGFSKSNLFQMRSFYLTYSERGSDISPDLEVLEIFQTLSGKFPLPWSHYVKLISVKSEEARQFYETEGLQNGWSQRQLQRQIASQFFERTLLSRNQAAMLSSGSQSLPEDAITPEEQIKDPFVLEFLDLKDEYSENDLEEALIRHLETFLLELGSDFAFMGRQRRLRIGSVWYRVDLLFFHRRLKCLVVIDLKLGEFNHADAGQMHLYLNYAREHWMLPEENPPVGLILCNKKDEAVARYALEGLPNKVMAAEYQMTLPDEELLIKELKKTRKMLENRLGEDEP